MRNIIRYILLVSYLTLSTFPGRLIASSLPDSTMVIERSFDREILQEYKDSGDYDYIPQANNGTNLLEVVLFYLADLFQNLFYLGTETQSGKFLIILIVIIVAVYTIMKIMKIRGNQLISSKNIEINSDNIHEENIHELNLKTLINEALKNENYREAIRLTYLEALKLLSERDIIVWVPGKTNSDYMNEIDSGNIKLGFKTLNYYFIHTWYGNFRVDDKHYSTVHSIFQNWKTSLSQ